MAVSIFRRASLSSGFPGSLTPSPSKRAELLTDGAGHGAASALDIAATYSAKQPSFGTTMTEKPDNTEEAVAWQWRWEGQSKWNFLDYLPRPDADESEPLFPLSSLETRDARIADLLAANNRYLERARTAEARLAEAVGALREVLSIWDQWGSLDSTDPDDRDAMEAARQALSSVGEG